VNSQEASLIHSPLIFSGLASEIEGSSGSGGGPLSLRERVDDAAGASIVIVELILTGEVNEVKVGERGTRRI